MRLNQGWSKLKLVSGGLDWVGAVKRKRRLIQSIAPGNLRLFMPPPQLHHLNSHPCYRIGKWQRSSINLV